MSAFEIYLRTGRRTVSRDETLELKFNPWHDPSDGRFTFAGEGQYFGGLQTAAQKKPAPGFRAGGGSFGGGGAGGSWDAPSEPNRPFIGRGGSSGGGGAAASWRSQSAELPPPGKPKTAPKLALPPVRIRPPRAEARLTKVKNDYRFELDAHVRTVRISGNIHFEDQPRSRRSQAEAGGFDRRQTDDGGHFVAARFNGPRDWFNHFAQDANFNRGAYRVLEDHWARLVRSGEQVFVDIVPHYHDASMRPYLLTVRWFVGGERHSQDFPNERSGGSVE